MLKTGSCYFEFRYMYMGNTWMWNALAVKRVGFHLLYEEIVELIIHLRCLQLLQQTVCLLFEHGSYRLFKSSLTYNDVLHNLLYEMSIWTLLLNYVRLLCYYTLFARENKWLEQPILYKSFALFLLRNLVKNYFKFRQTFWGRI